MFIPNDKIYFLFCCNFVFLFLDLHLSKIVGIRYYDGVAQPGESVLFVHESQNPHDENAIRVDNQKYHKVDYIRKGRHKNRI